MHVPMIDLVRIYSDLKEEIDATIARVIDHSSFILGEEVAAFEREFASFLGVEYAVGVGSGTDAITFALSALDVAHGDEVITTALSAFPTAEAILRSGATPVYVDIDPNTYSIDPDCIRAAISSRTKAIVPVHLYGLPAMITDIRQIADNHGLFVVEDCCQAHGAQYLSQHVGTFGEAGCFSFFPSKNLGAMGDGGLLVTNDEKIADKVRMLRDHGRKDRYSHLYVGYNSRLSGLQAAILRAKLVHLERYNEQRQAIGSYYNNALDSEQNFRLHRSPSLSIEHVYHLYVIRVCGAQRRDSLVAHLASRSIQTNIHYPIPLHHQPAHRTHAKLPVAERAVDEILSIPLFPLMRRDEMQYVVEALKEWRG